MSLGVSVISFIWKWKLLAIKGHVEGTVSRMISTPSQLKSCKKVNNSIWCYLCFYLGTKSLISLFINSQTLWLIILFNGEKNHFNGDDDDPNQNLFFKRWQILLSNIQ